MIKQRRERDDDKREVNREEWEEKISRINQKYIKKMRREEKRREENIKKKKQQREE